MSAQWQTCHASHNPWPEQEFGQGLKRSLALTTLMRRRSLIMFVEAALPGYRGCLLGRWLSIMIIGFVPDTASTALRDPGTHRAVTSGSQRLSG